MNTQNSIWTFRIKDETGSIIANLPNAQNRQVNIGLNKSGEASFQYDLKDFYLLAEKFERSPSELIGLARYSLEVLRNGVLFFGGQNLLFNRKVEQIRREIDVKALGYSALLSQMYIGLEADVVYTATDSGAILADAINDYQAEPYSDHGITIGTIQTSVNRTMGLQRKTIKELAEEMSGSQNGFDYEITPDKVLNVYYPFKGADITDRVVFKYPGNIERIEEINDATELVNYAFGIGNGTGNQELFTSREDVDSEIAIVRRQGVFNYKDQENATVLGDILQQVINERSAVQPLYKIKLQGNSLPNLENYALGDIVKVVVQDKYWKMSQAFRIFEIFISIDEDDTEDITLVVGLV